MALLVDPATDAAAGAAQVRMVMASAVRNLQAHLGAVRSLVGGRKAAITAALGPDAAEMATLYAKAKAFIDAAGLGPEPDIPAS
jgi:hypothetical protein